jgi:hypothetical protein
VVTRDGSAQIVDSNVGSCLFVFCLHGAMTFVKSHLWRTTLSMIEIGPCFLFIPESSL